MPEQYILLLALTYTYVNTSMLNEFDLESKNFGPPDEGEKIITKQHDQLPTDPFVDFVLQCWLNWPSTRKAKDHVSAQPEQEKESGDVQ